MAAMHRKKQVAPGAPVGSWSVSGGILTVMGFTIAAVMSQAPDVRDMHAGELWSGVASIAGAASVKGYKSFAFDLNRVPGVTDMPGDGCEDITTLTGFKKAILLVLRLREGGLLALGPDCSSFTFPNSSRHQRKLNEEVGDTSYEPVNVGNLMAVIALFLCQLALARRVHFALENPPDSHMFRFFERLCPDFMKMIVPDGTESRGVMGSQGLHVQSVSRCPYDDSPEPKLKKTYKWLATWPGIKGLNARCRCKQEHRRLGRLSSTGAWSGNLTALAESAAYPVRLGEALVNCWVQGGVAIDTAWSKQALALPWADPRDTHDGLSRCCSVEESQGPRKVAKVSQGQGVKSVEFGPWGESHNATSSTGSNTTTSDFGPWSSAAPSAASSAPSSGSSFGPWGDGVTTSSALGGGGSPSSSASPFGPWGSFAPTRPSKSSQKSSPKFGPWGDTAIASSSESEDRDAEPAPGQIGSPTD